MNVPLSRKSEKERGKRQAWMDESLCSPVAAAAAGQGSERERVGCQWTAAGADVDGHSVRQEDVIVWRRKRARKGARQMEREREMWGGRG